LDRFSFSLIFFFLFFLFWVLDFGVGHSDNSYNNILDTSSASVLTGLEKRLHKPLPGLVILQIDENTLTLQVDMSSKTVHFFLDNELVLGVIRKISDSIRFGVHYLCSCF
jgi:hypothetical protein